MRDYSTTIKKYKYYYYHTRTQVLIKLLLLYSSPPIYINTKSLAQEGDELQKKRAKGQPSNKKWVSFFLRAFLVRPIKFLRKLRF